MRILGMIMAAVMAIATPVSALTLPASGSLKFDVMRKGNDIGDHSFVFSGADPNFKVQIVTDIAVKLPIIRTTVYSFQHNSTEQWQGGEFNHVTSKTDDDGDPNQLNTAGKGPLPASLWNMDIVHSKKLMNTIDGHIMKVRVADLGMESVRTKRGSVNAHHYRISGDLERDLWYDGDGNLAQVVFKADDGSTITYIRK